MPILVKIKRFTSQKNSLGFPQYDMHAWLTPSSMAQLGILEASERGPQYVKIECKSPINRFVIYSIVASLNPRVENEEGYVWIPSELIHSRIIFDRNTEVEISPVNLDELPIAESITIRLKEKEVENWSEEESKKAIQNYRVRNGIAFMQQLMFVKPRTKRVVVGEIESIFPRPAFFSQLYLTDENTRIVLEGLPKDLQKVIDFTQIGGLDSIIDKLREIIQIPITYPDHLQYFGIKPPKGMLMYGPPGNGKTMIARAVAQSMGASFFSIEGPELLSKELGENEKRLSDVFVEAENKGNSVIFIDEIDSIAPVRNESAAEYQVSLVARLLTLMDGLKANNVFVIGATNRISAIDPALRRPGRFDLEFEIPLPSTANRLDILSKYIKLDRKELFDESVSYKTLQKLSDMTTGYSGADLSLLYREAAMIAIRKNIKIDRATGKLTGAEDPHINKIAETDFFEAMRHIIPTSMRDIEQVSNSVQWDELIGVNETKRELEELHNKLKHYVNSDILKNRPSFANIILSGIKGSGKRTLICSFASHFGYEVFNIDILRLQAEQKEDTSKQIEKIFSKAKQTAPSIVTISNVNSVESPENLLSRILNEISLVNKRTMLLVVLMLEDSIGLTDKYLGYKKFGKVISIPMPTESDVRDVLNKTGLQEYPIEDFLGKPIAQIMSCANEILIQNELES